MNHTIDDDGGVRVVHLSGPIDVSRSSELRDVLGQQINGPQSRVLVDLREVTLIDSSGIGIFVSAHRRADAAGAEFVLAQPGANVGRVFELTRTNRLLRIYDTLDEGVKALSAA
jgi:anti-anti-sigma factor